MSGAGVHLDDPRAPTQRGWYRGLRFESRPSRKGAGFVVSSPSRSVLTVAMPRLTRQAAHRRTQMPVFEPVTSRFSAPELEQRHPRVLARARRVQAQRRGAARRPRLLLLRGPADGERQPRHPPRARARVQGPDPALPDDARLPRASEGRVGHARPARGARGRAAAGAELEAATSRSTASRSSTRSARSRSSATSRSGSG